MDITRKVFIENLRRHRNMKRFSQAKLAEMSGISLSGYAQIEYGKVWPAPETLTRIAKALEVDVSELHGASETLKKTNAPELTPETLRAIQDATKASVLAAIEESKGLPGKFETYKTERQQLDSLIDLLDDNQVKGLLEAVQKLIVNKKKARSIVG